MIRLLRCMALVVLLAMAGGCRQQKKQATEDLTQAEPEMPGIGHAVELTGLTVKLLEADLFRSVGREPDLVQAPEGHVLARVSLELILGKQPGIEAPEPSFIQGGEAAKRATRAEEAYLVLEGNQVFQPRPLEPGKPARMTWFFQVKTPVMRDDTEIRVRHGEESAVFEID